MRVGEAARTSLCPPRHPRPSDRWPGSRSPPTAQPLPVRIARSTEAPAGTGPASTEVGALKGPLLARSLTARRANRSSSNLTPHPPPLSHPPPSSPLGGFLLFRLLLVDLGVSLTL